MSAKRGNWLELRVARRVIESDVVVSLHLVTDDGSPLPSFVAGQFLTLRIPKADGGAVPRNYSLSNDPADTSHYRISVKRESAPAGHPELPAGIGSQHVHDVLVEGAVIQSLAPRGDFVLDSSPSRPVLLLAGGIGVTPLAAMAHALTGQAERQVTLQQVTLQQVTLIHACENGQVQALGAELRALAESAPSFRYLVALASPSQQDKERNIHQFEGMVDPDFLRSVLPIGDYDCYLCGPKGFMQAMYRHLIGLGVSEQHIRYEFFGPASLLTAAPAPPPLSIPVIATPGAFPEDGIPIVIFGQSGASFKWDPARRTLLEFAEAHGFSPAFSCRSGICSTCLCGIEGTVDYIEDPLDMPEGGKALICCSVPKGNIILDL